MTLFLRGDDLVQALFVYAIELLALIGLIFILHWLSPKIGLLPVLFVMMTLNTLIALSSFVNTLIILPSQMTFFIVGHIFIPVVILSFLVIYIVHGQAIAQVTLTSFVLVNILTMLIMIAYFYYAQLDTQSLEIISSLNNFDVSMLDFIRNGVASILGFSTAMLGSVIAYQSIRNLLKNIHYIIAIFVALTLALWLDAIIYMTVGTLGLDDFLRNLTNDFFAKTLISIVILIPAIAYLELLSKHRQLNWSYGRPILGIVFGFQAQFRSGFLEMQSELYLNQQIYQHLTENLDEIIYVVDIADNELIYVSPAFEAITGYTKDILENKVDNLQLVVHPDDHVRPPLLDFMLSHNPTSYRYIHKDGTIGWMNNRLLPIRDDDGLIYRYVGIVADITQAKERQKRELDLQVTQERVQVLQDFVRDASHDLKTPLSSILLKLDMMQKTDGERQQSLQRELKDRILYVSKMIDDLFTLSLIEGNDNTAYKEIDLKAIAQHIVDDLDAIAQTKSLTMTVDDTKADCIIMSTHDAMISVFTNLVSNAIRYTEKGDIRIKFSADDESVSFIVADSGIGIPEDELDKVFGRFFRSDNAREFADDGTGLGLAIIYAIIEKHKGTISVTSQIKQGSTFHICLPRQRS